MLRDPDFLNEVFDCLDSVYFSKDDYSILASLTLEYYQKNGQPPHKEDLIILIYDKAKVLDPDGSLGRAGTLHGWLARVFEVDLVDVQLIKDKVRDFGRLQSVARAVQKTIGLLEDTNPSDSGDDLVSKIQDTFNEACQVGTDKKCGTFFNEVAVNTPEILIKDKMYGAESRVPTGIYGLDKVLDGGPGAGTINVIMGPPNRGKSTILTYLGISASLHFARKALTDGVQKAVIHVTCEMNETDIQAKYAAGLTGIDLNSLTSNPAFAGLMEQRLKQTGPVYIQFYSPGTVSVDDIKWYISNLVMTHKVTPGLLILDYADKLKGMEDDRFRGMGMIYDQLIALGHKFTIPTWTGSQINRAEAQKDKHSVHGAAESWKKVEAADNIVILNQTEEQHRDGTLLLGLGKIRRGSRVSGSIQCKVDFGTVSITQSEGDVELIAGTKECMASVKAQKYASNLIEAPNIPNVKVSPEIVDG